MLNVRKQVYLCIVWVSFLFKTSY